MKKIFLMSMVAFGIGFSAQAQQVSAEVAAQRKMTAYEKKMLKENTDEEAVKLIKEHEEAKKQMDGKMSKLPGYGDAATNPKTLQKFKIKNAEKDPEFKKLVDKEVETRKAKEAYLSSKDEEYKKAMSEVRVE